MSRLGKWLASAKVIADAISAILRVLRELITLIG
ncbi:hypothetical protein BMS3Bbin10_00763 [bacterium BMS3Bbin10]|nr:hypothetical protein BMS3Bbin10_00763 [bacterium BMS3Bbin10]